MDSRTKDNIEEGKHYIMVHSMTLEKRIKSPIQARFL